MTRTFPDRIPIHDGLHVALDVLTALDPLLSDEEADRLHVSAFSNCREQGLTVTAYSGCDPARDGRVVVCECRNSDEILVYHGPASEFDNTTHHPDDWDRVKRFPYQGHEAAATFAHSVLFPAPAEPAGVLTSHAMLVSMPSGVGLDALGYHIATDDPDEADAEMLRIAEEQTRKTGRQHTAVRILAPETEPWIESVRSHNPTD